jgi:CRISPR/Cas system Type II protein with McrA/HNH and RuvC-like nuclease domain
MNLKTLWEKSYKGKKEIVDYSGREIRLVDLGNSSSPYEPTIDHIRPLSFGGADNEGNCVICSRITNAEKGDRFPTWTANGRVFQARKVKGSHGVYQIWGQDNGD